MNKCLLRVADRDGRRFEGGGRGDHGLTTARLFDPNKAGAWLRNGSQMMVERKIAERKGQGVLRLVADAG